MWLGPNAWRSFIAKQRVSKAPTQASQPPEQVDFQGLRKPPETDEPECPADRVRLIRRGDAFWCCYCTRVYTDAEIRSLEPH